MNQLFLQPMRNVDRKQINSFASERRTQQFNGREGETAALLFGLSVSLKLRVGGFAPRHLNRWLSRGGINARCF